jgi:S-adenosylmethionine uptake transporter
MLWAVFLGYFMFKEGVDTFTWVGIAVILAAGLFTLLREEQLTGWWHRQRWLP